MVAGVVCLSGIVERTHASPAPTHTHAYVCGAPEHSIAPFESIHLALALHVVAVRLVLGYELEVRVDRPQEHLAITSVSLFSLEGEAADGSVAKLT